MMRRPLLALLCLVLLPVLAACAPQYRGAPGYDPGPRHAMPVAEAQAGLERLGFDPGPVDGLYGPKTRSAILDFQRMYGLRRTGRIDGEFARRLDAELAAMPRDRRYADRRASTRSGTDMIGGGGDRDPRSAGRETAREGDDPGARDGAGEELARREPAESAPAGPLPDLGWQRSGHDPALLAAAGVPESELAKVRVASIDLDGDGDLDAVLNNENPRYCGTQGCAFIVYFKEGGSYRAVARLLASEMDAATGRTNGVRDLLVTGRRGSTVWQWDGSRYVPAV